MYLPRKERGKKKAEKTSFVMIAITLPHTSHNGTYLIALSLLEKMEFRHRCKYSFSFKNLVLILIFNEHNIYI